MVNIFYFDNDKYCIDEIKGMVDQIQNVLPSEDTLIAIPKDCNLYLDVPIDMLYYYRKMFDDLIDERQRRNIDKNDL